MAASDETRDAVLGGQLTVLQSRSGYRFSLDAVLLADFVSPASGRVVDLGTGSGVIAMIVAHRAPTSEVLGIELQPELAERARRSVELNQLSARVKIVDGDLRKLEGIPRGVDLVVSNPPYQPSGHRVNPSSEKALARHELTCTVADVVSASKILLRDGGHLALVYPAARVSEVLVALEAMGFRPRRLRFIHPRLEESARMVLLDAELAGKGALEVLPPLVLHEPNGRTYLPEAARILGERS